MILFETLNLQYASFHGNSNYKHISVNDTHEKNSTSLMAKVADMLWKLKQMQDARRLLETCDFQKLFFTLHI